MDPRAVARYRRTFDYATVGTFPVAALAALAGGLWWAFAIPFGCYLASTVALVAEHRDTNTDTDDTDP